MLNGLVEGVVEEFPGVRDDGAVGCWVELLVEVSKHVYQLWGMCGMVWLLGMLVCFGLSQMEGEVLGSPCCFSPGELGELTHSEVEVV